jgi:hypothetical protein
MSGHWEWLLFTPLADCLLPNTVLSLWAPINVPFILCALQPTVPASLDLQVIDSSDVVVQVLDARDPMGTRSPHIEAYLKKEKPWKHLIFVLNKCDLVPTWATVSSARDPKPTVEASRASHSLAHQYIDSKQQAIEVSHSGGCPYCPYWQRASTCTGAGQSHLPSPGGGSCRLLCPPSGGSCQSLTTSPLCSINCI